MFLNPAEPRSAPLMDCGECSQQSERTEWHGTGCEKMSKVVTLCVLTCFLNIFASKKMNNFSCSIGRLQGEDNFISFKCL